MLTAAKKDETDFVLTTLALEQAGFRRLIDLLSDRWRVGRLVSEIERGCLWGWDRYGRFHRVEEDSERFILDRLADHQEFLDDRNVDLEDERDLLTMAGYFPEQPIFSVGFFFDSEGRIVDEPADRELIRQASLRAEGYGAEGRGDAGEKKETAEQRQDRRLAKCRAAGLQFGNRDPFTKLRRMPIGIGKVAVQLGIARQTLSADLNQALDREDQARRAGAPTSLMK